MLRIFTFRTTLLGLVTWLVPFAVAFLFFDRNGQLQVPLPLFKSIMIVVFGGLGAALLVIAFRWISPSLRSGLLLGCYWLAINLTLDLLVLVPFVKMPVIDYFYDIGLRYLLIPIVSTAMGMVASQTPPQGR
jgi:hypothetical protein